MAGFSFAEVMLPHLCFVGMQTRSLSKQFGHPSEQLPCRRQWVAGGTAASRTVSQARQPWLRMNAVSKKARRFGRAVR
jgi:hypothetical protein